MSNDSLELYLGLGQGILPQDPDEFTSQVARRIADLGVSKLMTHFEVAPDGLTGRRGQMLADRLGEAGLSIAQYGGFAPCLVSPDPSVRAADIAHIVGAMASARAVGAEALLFGCGSHHPSFNYGADPRNHTAEARDRLVGSLQELARHAEDESMPVTLEVHVLTTLDTPEHVREIFDAVDSPLIRANFDPVNFLGSLLQVFDSGAVTEHAARTIGPRLAPTAHIKDVLVEPDLVVKIAEAAPGTGIMDLDAVVDACRHLPPESSLLVEHLGPEESEHAIEVVKQVARRRGVRLR